MKILFLVPYPTEGASNRVRVEQFLPYLRAHGVTCRVRPFVNVRFFRILYLPHRYVQKFFWFTICTFNRLLDVARAFAYGIVFIHREAYPFGGPCIEKMIRVIGKPIVFDFDDAIFLPNTSETNVYIERFKRPGKTADIISMSKATIAGNRYLATYAGYHTKDVCIIPSSADTARYLPRKGAAGPTDDESGRKVVIGWLGSPTTKNFLYELEDVFVRIAERFPELTIAVVGAEFHSSRLKNVTNIRWDMNNEVEQIRSFDIGIMPMPDNEWTRGKCAFKAILYMSCGVPVVVSDVGANKELVEDGVNGFLAKDAEDWYKKLVLLINDKTLREKLGGSGRMTVVERYSLAANASKLLSVLRSVNGKG